jgi:TRAP-type C4-dicarboxylate transport system substrate-binding protein
MIKSMPVFVAVIVCTLTQQLAAQTVVKLGTVAPEGSVWHDALLQLRQEWRDITDGEVELRIYAGGVLGGEGELVRKLQRRGVDAAAMTGVGLPRIDRSVEVLNIPLLFESYEEFDYVRTAIAPRIESRLAELNYRVLTWADAGWVLFFSKSPVRTPDELRDLRLMISAGAPREERLFKDLGFQVVPLPITEMQTGLQTGLVEVIYTAPIYALLDRSYQVASYMSEFNWAPLNAAVIIRNDIWERIPAQYHAAMDEAADRLVEEITEQTRADSEEAIVEMQKRGLTIVEIDETNYRLWRQEAEAAYPTLREYQEFPELFDEVLRLSSEYKARNQTGTAAVNGN